MKVYFSKQKNQQYFMLVENKFIFLLKTLRNLCQLFESKLFYDRKSERNYATLISNSSRVKLHKYCVSQFWKKSKFVFKSKKKYLKL